MILTRESSINLQKIRSDLHELDLETDQPNIHELEKLLTYYFECSQALNEVGTRLEILDADYQFRYEHNPIHHMERRMKSVSSLLEKIQRKQIPFTYDAITNTIYDIAGIRVITNYLSDVEAVASALLENQDMTLVYRRDYISDPKPSGYRSLHLVMQVPFTQSDGVRRAPVEIQIRTIGMDMWASLEHKLRYKSQTAPDMMAQYSERLTHYAGEIAQIESGMQGIFQALKEKH
ncbi:MAG: GTP pyrophosphokinase family protein [Aerococcus sp.]|nr:GTP pyrophosphokinase family protein [Aerococcus sp.]